MGELTVRKLGGGAKSKTLSATIATNSAGDMNPSYNGPYGPLNFGFVPDIIFGYCETASDNNNSAVDRFVIAKIITGKINLCAASYYNVDYCDPATSESVFGISSYIYATVSGTSVYINTGSGTAYRYLHAGVWHFTGIKL